MFARQRALARRLVITGVDLLIDAATLGEYGLEPLPADGPCPERAGHPAGWEALRRSARGACATDQRSRARL